MKITQYRGTSEDKLITNVHNIWLGISLGNKYFTLEHLEDYIRSSLDLVKEKMLIIIADQPQAVNYEVFEKIKPKTANAKACRNGQKIFDVVNEIILPLPKELQEKIDVIKWGELSKTVWYRHRYEIFCSEFLTNFDFKSKLVEIVKLNMGERIKHLQSQELVKLCEYVLKELPIFMGAMSYKDIVYDLHIYPGLSLMDDLILDIQEGILFPNILKQITITKPLAIAEAYAGR